MNMSNHAKYKSLKNNIIDDYNSMANIGWIGRARELSDFLCNGYEKSERLNDQIEPGYFTGNLDSNIVFIMLNPGASQNHHMKELFELRVKYRFKNNAEGYLEDYLQRQKEYGKVDRERMDNFDTKQAAFLLPFGFKELKLTQFWDEKETTSNIASNKNVDLIKIYRNAALENKENVISNKLQLELIPYGSRVFDTKIYRDNIKHLDKYFENIFDIISEKERKIIIFGGTIFNPILEEYQKLHPEKVKLFKRENFEITEKINGSCRGVVISTEKGRVRGIIANTFANRSLPNAPHLMKKYGKSCYEIYKSLALE